MIKKILFISFFLFIQSTVYAEEYILPYPGPMPGNKLHLVMDLIDAVQKYWSWGSIAQSRYLLSLSDKYLVEAKILFEYKQYVLAIQSLDRSNNAIAQVNGELINAFNEGKSIEKEYMRVIKAYEKHKEVISMLKNILPKEYVWTPEKSNASELRIGELLDRSIEQRIELEYSLKKFMNCMEVEGIEMDSSIREFCNKKTEE